MCLQLELIKQVLALIPLMVGVWVFCATIIQSLPVGAPINNIRYAYVKSFTLDGLRIDKSRFCTNIVKVTNSSEKARFVKICYK